MRLIRQEVTGEISATSYKKLVAALKPLNKRQLWAILDHYLFHVITDQNADELLRLLQEMKAAEAPVDVAAATEDEIAEHLDQYRPRFEDTITSEVLDTNRLMLDMMFDESYFENYLFPEARASAAKKILAYCEKNNLPVEQHWLDYAGQQ
jgi:hypothetical protein